MTYEQAIAKIQHTMVEMFDLAPDALLPDARLVEDLERSRRGVAAAEGERFARLQLVAEMVASFPELRALLATDAATVRDFLSDYRERHGLQGLLIALNSTGQVVARSDTFAPLELPDVERTWLTPLRLAIR